MIILLLILLLLFCWTSFLMVFRHKRPSRSITGSRVLNAVVKVVGKIVEDAWVHTPVIFFFFFIFFLPLLIQTRRAITFSGAKTHTFFEHSWTGKRDIYIRRTSSGCICIVPTCFSPRFWWSARVDFVHPFVACVSLPQPPPFSCSYHPLSWLEPRLLYLKRITFGWSQPSQSTSALLNHLPTFMHVHLVVFSASYAFLLLPQRLSRSNLLTLSFPYPGHRCWTKQEETCYVYACDDFRNFCWFYATSASALLVNCHRLCPNERRIGQVGSFQC